MLVLLVQEPHGGRRWAREPGPSSMCTRGAWLIRDPGDFNRVDEDAIR